MTLEEAVAILSRHKHNGCGDWRLAGHREFVYRCDNHASLEPFEAIAIAEKYEREGDGHENQIQDCPTQ